MLRKILICFIMCQAAHATLTPIATNGVMDPDISKIEVEFYSNHLCKGEPIAKRIMHLQNCFSWTRKTETGTRDNSANNFICHRDKICYTQYPLSKNCKAARPELTKNKFFSTHCKLEPGSKKTWSIIKSGTEKCPLSKKDFKCPS